MATAVTTENIIRQGYLKKSVQTSDPLPSTSKIIAKNIKQKLEPSRWYVFGVRNRRPYMEFFENEESVFCGQPLHHYSLSTFQNLTYTMSRNSTDYSFCIYIQEGTIELTASSRTQMMEWCRCLERNLRNLGLRGKNRKEDHEYTSFPVRKKPLPPDPSKPLPPDPINDPSPTTSPTTSSATFDSALLNISDIDNEDSDLEVDNPYEDGNLLVRDTEDIADSETIPLRPPPVVPRRDFSSASEDIFATMSDVRRSEELKHSYMNFQGFDHDVDDKEKELFNVDTSSESEKEDADVPSLSKGKRGDDKAANILLNVAASNIGRQSNMGRALTELDTSEDSDFIPASFWLRNRKPSQKFGNNSPTLPLRYGDGETERHSLKNRVSMDSDSLICGVQRRSTKAASGSISPDLYLDPEPFLVVKPSIKEDPMYDNPKPARRIHINNSNNISHKNTERNHAVETKLKVCDSDKDRESCESMDNGKCLVEADSGNDSDNVYGSTWECSSTKPNILDDDMYLKPSDTKDMCKGMNEPERLFVDLQDDTCCKKAVKKQTDTDETYVKPKQRNKLSKIFSRKAKDKELPERLVVDLPPPASSCLEKNQPDMSNVYSDFPLHPPRDKPASSQADSDLLKISLSNGHDGATQRSPIELPTRNFSELTSKSKQNSCALNLDIYEDVCVSSRGPSKMPCEESMPEPPAKLGVKHLLQDTPQCKQDLPIAPPRRKKSGNDNMAQSFTSSVYGTEVFSSEKPALPTRTSPPLPARKASNANKPELPPPMRPRKSVVARQASDASSARSYVGIQGGARPKTIHIAMRQQSTTSPSSSALTVMNLKQNQVDLLKSEIESASSLKKTIPKVHFQHGLALVEVQDKIWISGWDVKRFPRLYDKFHIGDQIESINDVLVTEMSFVHKLLKNIKADHIEICIRRIPKAHVFAIQRSAEGESLGIKREANTAEIVYLDPHGLACRHGLINKTPAMDGMTLSNWALTEVNMRPLNLFPKGQEIEHRLLAVGKDISIVVQPADFVKELRKQMKKLKSYKDFLIR